MEFRLKANENTSKQDVLVVEDEMTGGLATMSPRLLCGGWRSSDIVPCHDPRVAETQGCAWEWSGCGPKAQSTKEESTAGRLGCLFGFDELHRLGIGVEQNLPIIVTRKCSGKVGSEDLMVILAPNNNKNNNNEKTRGGSRPGH